MVVMSLRTWFSWMGVIVPGEEIDTWLEERLECFLKP